MPHSEKHTKNLQIQLSDQDTAAEEQLNKQDEVTDLFEALAMQDMNESIFEGMGIQTTLEMICSAAMDPITIIDAKGIIKTINTEFLRLLGYKRWELIGKNIKMIMPEKYAKNHDGYLLRYQRSKMRRIIGEKRDRISAIKKDGSEFPVELKVTQLNCGQEMVFIGTLKNVTHDQELLKIRDLLTNMLPKEISDRIQQGENEIAEEVEGTVLFIDLCDYDKNVIAGTKLVKDLNYIFKGFDNFCSKYKIEKLKTIGDAYMAVCTCGTKKNVFDFAIRCVELALQVRNFVQSTAYKTRIGIATGTFIQGVLSGNKLSFDVWGDCVNIASRLQHLANAGEIMVDARTYDETSYKYKYHPCNVRQVKGKGEMQTYMINFE